MDYQHLTTFERGRIEALHNSGYTVREIGQQMNRHHSTIARELSRNNNINYYCETAQEAYFYRRKASKPKGKCSTELIAMHNLFLINSRPRKCLAWKSSIQLFLHELSHLT
jgi:IS30 family transposase